MNIPYEKFLTIQMHLTYRKDRIHNHLQAKKNEDLFRRTSDNSSKTMNKYDECSAIIDIEPSIHEEVIKKKWKTSSRRMMSRMQYQYMKRSS